MGENKNVLRLSQILRVLIKKEGKYLMDNLFFGYLFIFSRDINITFLIKEFEMK